MWQTRRVMASPQDRPPEPGGQLDPLAHLPLSCARRRVTETLWPWWGP
jgi:hypothetical protein